jgi:HK97 family phage prohead protease
MLVRTDQPVFTDDVLEGWVIRYNSLSVPWKLPSGRMVFEQVASGAFAESCAAITAGLHPIRVNVEHGGSALVQIGSTESNAQVEHRPEGVHFRMQMLADSVSADIVAKARANVVNGLSVEMNPYPGEEAQYEVVGGDYLRTWRRMRLDGIAITTAGRYPDAVITAVSKEKPEPAMARSINDTELAAIAREVEAWQGRALIRQREHEAFALGIR